MTVTVKHSTLADGTFSATGATAWDADHTLSGVLPVLNGGTGTTTSTGTGSVVLSASPTITGNPIIGQHYTLGETVTIATGGEGSIVNIGYGWGESLIGCSTYINGNVTLGNDVTYDTVNVISPFNVQSLASFSSNLTASGGLNLFSNGGSNNNIATSQTTGTLAIGGTGAATGAITLGRSTGAQTVNIATGVNNISAKTLNLGTGATNGATTINIGPSATTNGNTTVNIATQTRNSNSTTVNIGTNATGGTSNIILGSSGTATNITSNGIVQQRIYTGINSQTATAGRIAFVSDHRSANSYPIFGEAYSITGTFGPFNVPVFADGTIWRVG